MEYQNLVELCKQAYNKNDLSSAYKYWGMIYEVLDKKLSKIDINNEEDRFKCYEEYNSYMKQFTDKEVYDITDYGKTKAYRQMELERTYNILNESVKIVDKLNQEYVIKCPLCGEELNYKEYNGTHIYYCEPCPFIGFEYVDHKDLENLTKWLEGK